ncbi:hypothetical protein M3914_003119 [Vibrio metschnikovii]|nr:hypothetical protein [Vibrio metschnikovii]
MKTTFSSIILSLFVLTGCQTAKLPDSFRYNSEIERLKIERLLLENESQTAKVVSLDRPPQKAELIIPDNRPQWLSDRTMINAEDLPLSLAIRQIVGSNIPIRYGHAVSPSAPANIFFEGSKEEALNILSLNVNYGITATKDAVRVDKFLTKTYSIPNIIGEESFQMGSSSGSSGVTSSDASEGAISSTGGGDGQYASSTIDGYNIAEQINTGIKQILGGGSEQNTTTNRNSESTLGYSEVIRGTSSIVVRASPAIMKLVDDYVYKMIDDLQHQVELEITVIEFQQEDQSEFGINGGVARKRGSGTFNLNLSAPSLGGLEALGLGVDVQGGRWEGSSMVINALRQAGNVSVKTQQSVTASNHKVQEIDLSTIQSYISSTQTTFEGENNNIPRTSIETSVARDGVKLFALANIQDDRVYLRLNGVLSKVIRLESTSVNGVTIEKPLTRQARFNTTGAYRYNETIVVTHMRQETNEDNTNRQADIPIGNSGRNKVVDTLVLLTPRKTWR